MPARYEIDTERRIILSSASGTLKDEDLQSHQQALLSDPAFAPTFCQLWDFRGIDRVEVSNALLRELAGSRSFAPGAKRAVVASRDLLYGLARMFQIMHDDAPEDFQVFRTLEDATSWLGIEPD